MAPQPSFPILSDLIARYNVPLPHFEHAGLRAFGDDILHTLNPGLGNSATKGWPLGGFDQVVAILAAYLLWVLVAPTVVKTLQPSKRAEKSDGGKTSVLAKFAAEPIVLPIQTIYNLAQVFLCYYMMKGAVVEALAKQYSLICNKFDPSETGIALVLWVFYTSKILDFFDTIFMVLRGKWRQLSFLHVYHHVSIFLFYWVNINVAYDGDVYYTIVVNSFIHFVMYGYYFLTTLNIPIPKPVKMLVTNMQLVQFVTMMGQAVYILVVGCPYPQIITAVYLGYILSLFLLFNNFKAKTYKSSDKAAADSGKTAKQAKKNK